jgi:hypothetical protein
MSSILGFLPTAHHSLSFQLEMSNVHPLARVIRFHETRTFLSHLVGYLEIPRQQSLVIITRLNPQSFWEL